MTSAIALEVMTDINQSRQPELVPESVEETFSSEASLGANLAFATSENTTDENLEREVEYEQNLLKTFRQRLRLLSSLTAAILPLYALLHAVLSPSTRQEVASGHLALLSLCLVVRSIAPRLPTLYLARLAALVNYALFSLGTALIAAQLVYDPTQTQLLFTTQFVAYSSFSQIVLSTLILPLTVWESALVTALVFVAMSWSSFIFDWPAIFSGVQLLSVSYFFVLTTTSLLVFYLTHLNGVQRRRFFEATRELEQSAARLETLTTLDTVTGGWNRRHLERVLHNEMARAARFAHAFTLLAFDLDNFKAVNDTHGHGVGDEVLRVIDRSARQAMRETDTVARFGGDEFAIVLPETSQDSALTLAQRLQQRVQQELEPLSATYPQIANVTISIGLFTCRERSIYTPAELLQRTDAKLYQAKSEGKNRIAI